MTIIPKECLNQLICTRCLNYLSIFPITQSPDGDILCGRCQNASIYENSFHNRLSEILLQHIEFPCFYSKEGCYENLCPDKMKEHETRCHFKPRDCPLHEIANCTWKGSSGDFSDHCHEQHKESFLNNSKFEMDCLDLKESQKLVSHIDNLFILKRKIDPTTKTLTFSVWEVQNCLKTLQYQISLSDEDQKNSIINTSDTIQNPLQLCIDNVNNILKNPSIIKGKIKFFTDGENFDDEIFCKGMLDELKCLICNEYMNFPVRICDNGHSLCFQCKTTVKTCPVCSLAVVKCKSDVIVKNLVNQIIGPCKYYTLGCKFVSKFKNLRDHQQFCKFSQRKCPLTVYSLCEWKGLSHQLIHHIKDKHNDSFEAKLDLTLNNSYCRIKSFFGKIFVLRCGYAEDDDEKYCWSVQLVGPKSASNDYKFKLSIKDETGDNEVISITKKCLSFSNQFYKFKKCSECIFLHNNQIEYAVGSKIFVFKVDIIQINN